MDEAEILSCSLKRIEAGQWEPGALVTRDYQAPGQPVVKMCALGIAYACITDQPFKLGTEIPHGHIRYPTDIEKDDPRRLVAEATVRALFEAIPEEWRKHQQEVHGGLPKDIIGMETWVLNYNDSDAKPNPHEWFERALGIAKQAA